MTSTFDQAIKEQIRTKINIVDLIASYTELRNSGRQFVALCPWHNDTRPSLQINPDRQTWKCWVCDIGGDVFSWVMQKEGMTFPEAARLLADRAGVSIPELTKGGRGNDAGYGKKQMLDAMRWVVERYRVSLQQEQAATNYLIERGIAGREIERFQVGYAPAGWNWLRDEARKAGIDEKLLHLLNVLVPNQNGGYYDRFRARVLFPICDPLSNPIAIGGRILPGEAQDREQAKYINSSETPLYHKSHQLYGLHLAREAIAKSKMAVVVEGYTDVIMAHQHGLEEAVAVCGTALGDGHIRLLKRYCDSVVLLLDGDEAGQKRTNEILNLFVAANVDLRVATLPDGLDPCDFLIQRGGDAMREVIAGASDALEHKIQVSIRGFDPLADTHRATQSLEDILRTLALTPDSNAPGAPGALRREQMLNRLQRTFGISIEMLRKRMKELKQQNQRPRSAVGGELVAAESPTRGNLKYADLDSWDLELLEIFVLHPEVISLALERCSEEYLRSEPGKLVWRVYRDLEANGADLGFDQVLCCTEDPMVKNLLASIHLQAVSKQQVTRWTGPQRLQALLDHVAKQEQQQRELRMVEAMRGDQLGQDEAADLLLQLVAHRRFELGVELKGQTEGEEPR